MIRAFLQAVVFGPVRKFWLAAAGQVSRVPAVPGLLLAQVALHVAGNLVVLAVPTPGGMLLIRMPAAESRAMAWAHWEAARIADRCLGEGTTC